MEEEEEKQPSSNRDYYFRKSIVTQLITQKKSVFELLKLKEKDLKNIDKISQDFQEIFQIYKTLKKPLDNDIQIKKKNIDIYEVIQKLRILPEKRTLDDIYIIRKYIKTTNIGCLFFNEIKLKGRLYNTVLLFICLLMRFKFYKKDETIFRIGDQPDFLYLIIEGKIDILKPLPRRKSLTGNEYFLQLMEYRRNNDKHLYLLCIQENTINYEIKRKDRELIPYIYLLYRLNEIKKRIFVDFRIVFELINISPADLDLDSLKIHSIGYIYKKIKQIKSKIPLITDEELKYYKFIDDKETQKEVKIFEYETFLKFNKNKYFGENAISGKIVRNATIKTEEDCYLGYLDINLYNTNFLQEKKSIFDKKVNFLHSNFFFVKISQRKFEKRFFNFFISENYENNDYIYNENSSSNYIYFIEEGTVELTSTKSIIEIQLLLKGLGEMNSKIKEKFDYDKIGRSSSEIENYVMKKQMNKLLVLGKKNILGLESFYYQIPYITNARVISPKAKLIKIDSEHMFQILIKSYECLHELESKVDNTLKIITKRLFRLNNTKLKTINKKINLDEKLKLEKLLIEENDTELKTINNNSINNPFIKRSIKIIKPFNRNYLINTSSEIKNISNFLQDFSTEHKKIKKNNFSLILNDDSNSIKKNLINSSFPKNKISENYNKGKIASSAYEKRLLKKIKKEMIALRKGKNRLFSYIPSDKNLVEDKNSKEEKSTEINSNNINQNINFNNDIIKLSSLLKKYEGNLPSSKEELITNKNSKENSFEFVTKINNIKPLRIFEENRVRTRNRNLPKIKGNNIIGKNSFLSIISKNENSSKNKSRSTKELNVNFNYNNRVIKNYSFINKYINKENKIIKNFDPKEKYRIFDDFSKRISQTKNENKIDITEMKKYIPKTIRSNNLFTKIKKYQEYRKKIQRKIEEMSS